jgi:hypothetical protein
MSENKIGDVVVLKTDTQQQAFYLSPPPSPLTG